MRGRKLSHPFFVRSCPEHLAASAAIAPSELDRPESSRTNVLALMNLRRGVPRVRAAHQTTRARCPATGDERMRYVVRQRARSPAAAFAPLDTVAVWCSAVLCRDLHRRIEIDLVGLPPRCHRAVTRSWNWESIFAQPPHVKLDGSFKPAQRTVDCFARGHAPGKIRDRCAPVTAGITVDSHEVLQCLHDFATFKPACRRPQAAESLPAPSRDDVTTE